VFGIVSSPLNICRAQNYTNNGVFWCSMFSYALPHTPNMKKNTLVGVFSCLASFLNLTTHAKHKMTPSLVLFHARILFCPVHRCLLIILCINKYLLCMLQILTQPVGNFAGIPHPWSRDRNSAGMSVGQPKTSYRTPVSITS
jgi:hypothetical protein